MLIHLCVWNLQDHDKENKTTAASFLDRFFDTLESTNIAIYGTSFLMGKNRIFVGSTVPLFYFKWAMFIHFRWKTAIPRDWLQSPPPRKKLLKSFLFVDPDERKMIRQLSSSHDQQRHKIMEGA